MKKIHLTIVALVLAFSAPWSGAAATAFKPDTSECSRLLQAKDYSGASSNCEAAAAKGDPAAQFNLSIMYLKGWGVAKDKDASLKWLHASADQHYPPALYALASRYGSGAGVAKDTKEAVRLLTDAADRGFVLAQMLLGRAYQAGYPDLGIAPNVHTAVTWFRRAAEQCDACQYELWRAYYFGRGVDKNPVAAAGYLKKAAYGGLPKAQLMLAFSYSDGDGVAKDDVQAYAWFSIAARGGNPTARKALPLFAKRMSSAEIEKGEAMAKQIAGQSTINVAQLCAVYQQFCGQAGE